MSKLERLLAPSLLLCSFSLPLALHAQRIPVDRSLLRANDVRILSRTGIRTLPRSIQVAQLSPGEYLIARVGDTATVRASTATEIRWDLPLRMVGADGTGQRLTLRPVVEVGGGGLRMTPEKGGFAGEILIGIEDEEHPEESRPLGRTIRVLVTANADTTTPNGVSIDHTNLPFVSVRIVALRPGDSVRVRLRPEFDPTGIDLALPVVRPDLSLRASPEQIQGFGLETATLSIRADGIAITDSLAVTLSSNRSRPEPTIVWLGASGVTTALIRSSGIDTAIVRAEAAGMQPASVMLLFVTPWAFVIAALSGGLVGGVIRYITLKTQRVEKILFVPLLVHVLLGVLAGFVTAVAYAVGINLLNVHPTATVGEALVFVIAALGAVTSGTLVSRILPAPKE